LRSHGVVIQQLYDVFSAGDVDALMSVIAEDGY
jgi:hypothetical protein